MGLTIKNISFSFVEKVILDKVSFDLEPGRIYALMGANGSGKTTLFNIITGFVRQQTGTIRLNEINVDVLKPYQRNRAGISRTFQDLRLIGDLTVKENINIAYKNKLSDRWFNTIFPTKTLKQQEISFQIKTKAILKQFHLSEIVDSLANEISYGQQKLLNIACCVANDAQILLLDEPVAGVNPVFRDQLVGVLKEIRSAGKSILLIEHNSEFINEVADEIFFLNNGNINRYPDMAILKQDPNVIKSYM